MENFLCQECGKCFLTNKKRLLHSKVHDKEEYECSICAKRVVGKKASENHSLYALSETLKIHVISNHFGEYFSKMGENFANTNGEGLETAHSSLRISKERHGFKIVRKIGTQFHGSLSKKSLDFYNSKRAKVNLPLRKLFKTPSPLSSPNIKSLSFSLKSILVLQ